MVDERQAPAEVSHRFAEAISAGDLDGALACWSPAAVIVTPEGSEVRGHAALTERFRQFIAVGAQLQISVSDEVRTKRAGAQPVGLARKLHLVGSQLARLQAAFLGYGVPANDRPTGTGRLSSIATETTTSTSASSKCLRSSPR